MGIFFILASGFPVLGKGEMARAVGLPTVALAEVGSPEFGTTENVLSYFRNFWDNMLSRVYSVFSGGYFKGGSPGAGIGSQMANISSTPAVTGGDRGEGLLPNISRTISALTDYAKGVLGYGGGAANVQTQSSQNQPGGAAGSTQDQPQNQSGQSGQEDGTDKNHYKLEPNQFKKVCGQNKYVLWWSKRGSDGKDLKEVKDKMQNSWLEIPKCEELAKCHCCCNTCTFPAGMTCPGDVCFSKKSPCDGSPVCNPKCKCNLCKSSCESYKEPTNDKAFDRDCDCQPAGCPETSAKGCKIVLYESESTWHYDQYNQGKGSPMKRSTWDTKISQSECQKRGGKWTGSQCAFEINNKDQTFKSNSDDAGQGGKGWIDKLEKDKGKCCKCVPEEQAKKGPGGSGK